MKQRRHAFQQAAEFILNLCFTGQASAAATYIAHDALADGHMKMSELSTYFSLACLDDAAADFFILLTLPAFIAHFPRERAS